MLFSPSPSMSNALRETKCFSRSTRCAGQIRPPVQRRTTSVSAGLLVDLAHGMAAAGRADVGKREGLGVRRPLLQHHPTICGMTSPARWTTTVSPMRTSLRAISSSLCSVALETTTPPTVTGSSLATGVSAPVRPTWISMSLQDRRRLLGRELVRDRPARRARDEAEPLLQVEPVDLVDDAVDVVAERRALRVRSPGSRRSARRRSGRPRLADWSAAPTWQTPPGRRTAYPPAAPRFAPAIGEEPQAAAPP